VRVSIPNAAFKPRWYQRPFMLHFTGEGHDGSGRSAAWVVHRRGGKDLTGMHTLNTCAHRRRGAYWHTFPTFEQGRKAIWEGFTKDGDRIIDNVFPEPLIRRRDNQQMVVELKCGSIYRIIGTDKIETVGAGPVGVLHSEYSIAKPKAADLIAPMLRENNGWEAYVYTPRGANHGKRLYDRMRDAAKRDPKRYFCELLTLYDTKAYDPDETLAEERAKGRPEALIRQEYLCDFTAALVGAVWGDLLEALEKRGGVCEFEHENDDVFTSWDLGVGDATSIWFWRIGPHGVPDVLDHYEAQGKPLAHYLDLVDSKPYRYVKHWLPHDARQRTLQTGVGTLDLCLEHFGSGKVSITPQLTVPQGIEAARWLLQKPLRIHERCGEGLEALRAYHYAYDEDKKTFSDKPEHDWASHTADAFRYLAVVAKVAELATRKPAPREDAIARALKPPTLDELFEMQPRSSGRI
jgi:phage terminase large subunit